MKTFIFCIIVTLHLIVLYNRLPAWHSNLTIWTTAAKTDPRDPWTLNNAAHYSHDKRTGHLLIDLTKLKVPSWMPIEERLPYYIGYKNLAETLRINGYIKESDYVESKLTEMIWDHPPNVTFITTEAKTYET